MWLFWQSWTLMLVSFLLGALATWFFLVRFRGTSVAPPVGDAVSGDTVTAAPRDGVDAPATVAAAKDANAKDAAAGPEAASDPGDAADLDTPAMGFPAPVAVEEGPFPRSAKPLADGTAPSPEYTVKGEIDSMLHHDRSSPSYRSVVADVWFRDTEDAEDAGFRPWNWRSRSTGRLPKLDASGRPVPGSVVDPADAAVLAAMRAREIAALEAKSPHGPGSVLPRPDGSAPFDDYRIKGDGRSMRYHTTESPHFGRTRADAWFRSEEDAVRAGFLAWNRGRQQPAADNGGRSQLQPVFEDGSYPGSAKPHTDGAAPTEEFTVKGNEDTMLYHTPESPFFDVTPAAVWFRSEADARRAGFIPWTASADAAPRS